MAARALPTLLVPLVPLVPVPQVLAVLRPRVAAPLRSKSAGV